MTNKFFFYLNFIEANDKISRVGWTFSEEALNNLAKITTDADDPSSYEEIKEEFLDTFIVDNILIPMESVTGFVHHINDLDPEPDSEINFYGYEIYLNDPSFPGDKNTIINQWQERFDQLTDSTVGPFIHILEDLSPVDFLTEKMSNTEQFKI